MGCGPARLRAGFLRPGKRRGGGTAVYTQRQALYEELEKDRESRLVVYVTGDRPGAETRISPEAIDLLARHLDVIGDVQKVSLLLYTPGGLTLAAWSLVNLVRQFCKEFEVIVPGKAHSAGTLICLGANQVMMTKQATLGPIDPSVTTPLNPDVPGNPQQKVPVSVENINGFVEFAREALGEGVSVQSAFDVLANAVHPLVLGGAYRARTQIRMLARKLLGHSKLSDKEVEKILKFLCSESGSHDYTINRKEAKEELGLPIVKPNDEQYALIKRVFDDISTELELGKTFNPLVVLGGAPQASYELCRALVESRSGGSDSFRSRGSLSQQQIQIQPGIAQVAVHDSRTFEGWEHAD